MAETGQWFWIRKKDIKSDDQFPVPPKYSIGDVVVERTSRRKGAKPEPVKYRDLNGEMKVIEFLSNPSYIFPYKIHDSLRVGNLGPPKTMKNTRAMKMLNLHGSHDLRTFQVITGTNFVVDNWMLCRIVQVGEIQKEPKRLKAMWNPKEAEAASVAVATPTPPSTNIPKYTFQDLQMTAFGNDDNNNNNNSGCAGGDDDMDEFDEVASLFFCPG